MPIDYNNYPKDWKQISERIREREGNRCKWCGAPNHEIIVRSNIEPAHFIVREVVGYRYADGVAIQVSEVPTEYRHFKHIRVVLTVAHLNHDITDNSDDNLAALCQRCHLRHDAKHHTSNAKRTRAAKKAAEVAASGQLGLFDREAS